ncbi:hypothetical protein BOTCAL_0207g00020 [Botryotinia calthae]|uniref:BTB domain-containing protein n=1 Tax=Botryotinia calthae TaxID=38488 RepID=A0A4Y8D1E9_9HELO|nr:hypothetical protein BOTCAL_0207g00020 [Botryotinia calthae]
MAMSSRANIVVDPDGDLVVLLNPSTPDSQSSTEMMSALNSTCSTPDTETSRDADVKKRASLELEFLTSESNLFYDDRILVSSKHMSLASPVFKAMIKGEFPEEIVLPITGKLGLPLPNDDPLAMKILIYIIHGKMNMVPLKIDLELFTQIAISVDKYQCREVVRLLPPIWKNGLSDTFETSWTNIARWVCIAWQFELEDEFLKATQMIREKSDRSLESLMSSITYDLPIPKYVVDKLESCRLEGMQKTVKILQDTINEYQSTSLICVAHEVPRVRSSSGKFYHFSDDLPSYKNDCDSMVLGTLIKSALSNGLYPLPEQPYNSWSLYSLTAKVDLLMPDSLCSKFANKDLENHDVMGKIRESIRAIDKSGLALASFKGPSWW